MNAKCHRNSQAGIVFWIFMCISFYGFINLKSYNELNKVYLVVGTNKVQSNLDFLTE